LISIGLDEVFIQIKSENLSTGLKNYFDYLWNQQVKVYEGHENVTKFFMNILDDLEEGEEYNILNANLGIEKVPEIISFFKEFHKKRNKKGIKSNFLFNNNMKGIQNEVALSPCEYKYLPTNFKSPLQMTFYKNKLYLSLWAKKSIGILIERQDVVDAFRGYFDGLWNKK